MVCEKCGTEVPAGEQFCGQCRSPYGWKQALPSPGRREGKSPRPPVPLHRRGNAVARLLLRLFKKG